MIQIYASINNEPEKLDNNITRSTSLFKSVSVVKVRNSGYGGGQNRYQGLVHEPEKNAPYNSTYGGEVWVNFQKNQNQHVKLPILEKWEEVVV